MSVFIGLIHDLLEVCFPRHVAVLVEDLKVTVEGGIQDREVLVNPSEGFVGKGDVERRIARFRGSRIVDGHLVEWGESEVVLDSLENANSGVIVCLGPGQVRLGSVLPGKCDGTCSVWYSSVEPERRQIRQGRGGESRTGLQEQLFGFFAGKRTRFSVSEEVEAAF